MTYLDTSALIKRFVVEMGSQMVATIVSAGERVATAEIAYVEVHAALSRKQRDGELSRRDYTIVIGEFERDWSDYVRLELRDETLVLARDLVQRHPLRAFDAVHLASALLFKLAIANAVAFAAADRRLLRAAEAEGLQALNVEVEA